MSKHTPGPWEVERLIDLDTEDNDYPGATLSFQEASGHPHESAITIWSERATADAHLIAAAPDLLEALRELANSVIEDGGIELDDWPELEKATAAIAKAEGK